MRKVQGYGLEMGLHSFKVSTLMNVCINALSVRNVQGYGLEKGIHSFMVSTLMNVCIMLYVCVMFKK